MRNDENSLGVIMSFAELKKTWETAPDYLVIANRINGWFTKGTIAVLMWRDKVIGKYKCIESGKSDSSNWEFLS